MKIYVARITENGPKFLGPKDTEVDTYDEAVSFESMKNAEDVAEELKKKTGKIWNSGIG